MSLWGLVSLVVSFAILAALLLWQTVDKKGSKIMRAFLIVAVLWWGMTLYYLPRGIMGWPKPGLPDYAVLLSWKVIEPSIDPKEAGLYLWMVPKSLSEVEESFRKLDPRYAYEFTLNNVPRAYFIPYSKKEHNKLGEAARKAKEVGGLIMFRRGTKRRGERRDSEKDESGYIVKTPREIIKKTE